ncbi:MAG: hypothetical protein JSS78_00575 [Bacteroidetes bacterium]|nr:hypothetical protein [Bacteroidota bacterium]
MKHHLLYSSLFFLIVFSSCTPSIYLPDRVNAPMLREVGEVRLTGSLKAQNNSVAPRNAVSPSVDFAISPMKNLGLIASYRSTNRYAAENDKYDFLKYQDSIHYTGNKTELGLGYYLPFGKRGLFEFYGGGAFGNIQRTNLRKYYGNLDATYFQVFFQPSIGFNIKDIFELSSGIRFNYHQYAHFNTDTSVFLKAYTKPKSDISSSYYVILSPYLNLNIGYQYVKFNIQGGFSLCATKPYLEPFSPFFLSTGLTFGLAPRFFNHKHQ